MIVLSMKFKGSSLKHEKLGGLKYARNIYLVKIIKCTEKKGLMI